MKITSIEKAKGDRYTVFVDGEYWYILDAEIIIRGGLKSGLEVDGEFLEGLKGQAERRKARERAYYLLGVRDHSCKELYDKLCHSVSPEVAAETVARVQEQGYLDDEKYAEKLARYCLETKKWGSRRAMQEMYRRGIDRETAQGAIDECGVDPIGQIKAVIEKKYAGRLEDGDRKEREKVVAALMRLGFGYGDIRRAIEEYAAEAEEEEWAEDEWPE